MPCGSSHLEINLQRVDKGHQPGEELLVDGVGAVGFERGAVFEFHHAAELVSLGARGDVFADPGFNEAGDATLERTDSGDDLLYLFRRDAGLPAKGKGVNDHGAILRVPWPLPYIDLRGIRDFYRKESVIIAGRWLPECACENQIRSDPLAAVRTGCRCA